MADEQNGLRSVNWSEVFSLTHIFKSFRMALHPSKLVLGLAVVVLVYATGRVLDGIWGLGDSYVYTATASGRGGGEIHDYFFQPAFETHKDRVAAERPRKAVDLYVDAVGQARSLSEYLSLAGMSGEYSHLKTAFQKLLNEQNSAKTPQPINTDQLLAEAKDNWRRVLGKVEDLYEKEQDRIESLLPDARKQAGKDIKADAALTTGDMKDRAGELLEEHFLAGRRALAERKAIACRRVEGIRGKRIFAALLAYEGECLKNAVAAVRYGNLMGGWTDYRTIRRQKGLRPPGGWPASAAPPAAPPDDARGFVFHALMGMYGLCWLVSEHYFYAAIFLAVALAVWAMFGGAIYRIAALQAARDEKISITQALRFSSGKFFSFLTAPLFPLGIILFLAMLLTFGGLIGNVPYVGEILVGALFGLAIIVGLLVAFLAIGLLAGFPLMYPTIAVEGSDSFDALSRSFSYVFQRPWRAALYGLTALVHGTICYLFVRLFAYVTLAATHEFVQWGVWTGGERLSPEADKVDVLWQAPTFDALHGPTNWAAMDTWTEALGATLIGLWVCLVVALVAAFLLSYAASSTTMIYYLLRRRVDATDLDDVYVEEAEEELPAELAAEAEQAEAAPPEADEDAPPAKPKAKRAARKPKPKPEDKDPQE